MTNRAFLTLLYEIKETMIPKLYNMKKGTASEKEIAIVKECCGFLSLLQYSSLTIKQIKQLWDESNLKYQ